MKDMTAEEARRIDLRIAESLKDKLCDDCPSLEYPAARTRCLPCPRRTGPWIDA